MSEKVPKIRFKQFKGEWKEYAIEDICEIVGGGTPSTVNSKYWNGSINWYSPTEIGSTVYVNKSKKTITELGLQKSSAKMLPAHKTILFTSRAGIGDMAILQNEGCTNQGFQSFVLKDEYNPYFIYSMGNKIKRLALLNASGSTFLEISGKVLGRLKIHIPQNVAGIEPSEQFKIGEYFKALDNLINNHQDKYDKLINIKKCMLEKMFPKEGKNIPEIRFKGFTEPWEKCKLDDISSIITKQTGFDYSETIKPSLITTKEEGTYSFIQNKDFDGENINLNTDFYIPVSVAKKFPKITIDTPSILISISGKIGNIGYYRLKEKAFIGGAVGICKLLKDNGSLIVYSLQSDSGQAYFNSLIKASSHANITVEDIRKIEVLLPKSFDEEQKISRYFNNLDNLINQNAQQLEKLKNIKKSLLEKMFV
ncbi:restriction endonuclease subunit S [Paraclostridium bifermentans]|uniref:restriction endonuclease subunit S n=1 Tax=Paraclostridium bifermentans TaxID=1490 RepID=UPI0025B00920|nr:restriction endonuclease subunit S [Paraclostridium bifermentans]